MSGYTKPSGLAKDDLGSAPPAQRPTPLKLPTRTRAATTEPEPIPQNTAGERAGAPDRIPTKNPIKPSTAHVPREVADLVNAERERTQKSAGTIICDSVAATMRQLPKLLRPARNTKGLFETGEPVQRTRQATVLLTYRIRESDLQQLDELVDKLGADSRTHLIATALTAHLESP